MRTVTDVNRQCGWVEGHWPYDILIASLSIVVYISSPRGNFIWDDVAQISQNPFIRDLIYLPRFFTADLGRYTAYGHAGSSPYYRPLFLVSYALDYLIWGSKPFGYHLTNIMLHAACSLLAFRLAIKLLNDRWAALWAAGIFAAHPVHAEAVAWIAGRADLLAGSFFFISFGSYLIFRESARKFYFGISVVTYMLALFSKEAAIPLPLLLVAYELSFKRHEWQENSAKIMGRLLLFLVVFALYFIMRTAALGVLLALPDNSPFTAHAVYAMSAIVLNYLRLFLLPVDLKLLYQISLDHLLDARVLGSATVAALLLGGICLTYRQNRTLFFVSMGFCISVLPVLGPTGHVTMVALERTCRV